MDVEPEQDLVASKLNEAERSALILLAQGHTAKSIASLTGRSVAAVNERLREARRKTGYGSSRELARVVAAQENRDEQIGVEDVQSITATAAEEARTHSATGLPWKGIAVMGTVLIGGIAAVLLVQSPPNIDDKLATESRDAVWAPAAEAKLMAGYGSLENVSGVTAACASTVCKVSGIPLSAARRSPTIGKEISPSGLRLFANIIEADKAGKNKLFTACWERADN